MDICNQCQTTNKIPTCVDSLDLGTIPDLTTAVHVYEKQVGTGRINRYDVTTNGAGLVTIAPQSIMSGQQYEYHVTLATDLVIIPITVGGTAYDCLNIEYEMITDAIAGTPESYASVTITI